MPSETPLPFPPLGPDDDLGAYLRTHLPAGSPPPVEPLLAWLRGPGRTVPTGPQRVRFAVAAAASVLGIVVMLGTLAWKHDGPEPATAVGVATWSSGWSRNGSERSTGNRPLQVDIAWTVPDTGQLRRRAHVIAAPHTTLVWADPSTSDREETGNPRPDRVDDARIRLVRGRVWIDSPNAGREAPLTIDTPHGAVRVVGTRIEVDIEDGSLAVRVERGAVDVAPRQGEAVRVEAGREVRDGQVVAASRRGRPTWLPQPTVRLAAGEDGPDRFTLVVTGDPLIDLDLPPLGVSSAGLWLEATDADGEVVHGVAIGPDQIERGPRAWLAGEGIELPAGRSITFDLRLPASRTGVPAYRWRALVRPPDGAPWLTPVIDLETPR